MTNLSKNTIKLARSLATKKGRKNSGLFLVDGYKMCSELSANAIKSDFIVVSDSASDEIRALGDELSSEGTTLYNASDDQILKISDTQTPQGIIAAAQIPEQAPSMTNNIVILDGVSDPGNLGTIIRTADWFGFDSIILSAECADIYNPKVVRSTMGSIFRTNIHRTDNLPKLLKNDFCDYEKFAAVLDRSESIVDCKVSGKFALIFGNESQGISEEVLEHSDRRFRIPGIGKAESLNVASAAAVSLGHFSGVL